jgi:hypothetical protein
LLSAKPLRSKFLSFSCALVKRFSARALGVLKGIAKIKKNLIQPGDAQPQQGDMNPKLNR